MDGRGRSRRVSPVPRQIRHAIGGRTKRLGKIVVWTLGGVLTFTVLSQVMAWTVVLCPRADVRCFWE
jgi:hypothetical protein